MFLFADAERFEMAWYWWLVIPISFLVVVWVVRARSGEPFWVRAFREALVLSKQGHTAEARCVLEQALDQLPTAKDCIDENAVDRFRLLLLLADRVRKDTGDVRRELELLNECLPLLGYIPPAKPGLDHIVNAKYRFHMNRGIAASHLGLFDQSVPAFRDALQVARQPDTRCKCLALLGRDLALQGDLTNREELTAVYAQFDQEAQGQAINPYSQAIALVGQAVLRLYENDKRGACRLLEQAIPNPSTDQQRVLDMLRRQDTTAQEMIALLLLPLQSDSPGPGTDPRQPLPPLADDL